MKNKKFETYLNKYSEEIGEYVSFSESIDSIIVVEHLVERDITNKLLKLINEGVTFNTKHLATKQDLEEIGLTECSSDYFLFDKPTSFTIPVLVPEKN